MMKHHHLPYRYRASSGFSLVEIVFSLAIIGTVIATILGLVSGATASSMESNQGTQVVSITTRVINDLIAMPFDRLWQASPDDGLATVPIASPADSVVYFNAEGDLLGWSSTKPPADAFYRCTVKKAADEASRDYSSGAYHLMRVQLHVAWPCDVSQPQERVFSTVIARY